MTTIIFLFMVKANVKIFIFKRQFAFLMAPVEFVVGCGGGGELGEDIGEIMSRRFAAS